MAGTRQIRFCRSADGTRIAYATHGHGAPLIKVAHWLSHLDDDWFSPVYRHWMDALSARHTLVCYDARDTGLSDRGVRRISLQAWVEDLEAVADSAGLRRFALLAVSQAGPIAIEYAARHPDRVSGLVLHGTYLRGRLRRAASDLDRREIEALLTLVEAGWAREDPAIRQLWATRFIPEGTLEQIHWFSQAQRRAADTDAVLRSMRTSNCLDVTERARLVRAPTLVMHSRGDAMVPFECGRDLAAAIGGAAFVPLESNNHLLLSDEPAWARMLIELDRFFGLTAPDRAVALASLTARERQLLDLIASGLDNREIAERLVISDKTVRNHVSHIFDKLGVPNRGQAIVAARDAGLGTGGVTAAGLGTGGVTAAGLGSGGVRSARLGPSSRLSPAP